MPFGFSHESQYELRSEQTYKDGNRADHHNYAGGFLDGRTEELVYPAHLFSSRVQELHSWVWILIMTFSIKE